MTTLAVTGASGKTGWRVVAEALARGWKVRAIVRPDSVLPDALRGAEVLRLELQNTEALHAALQGCDALVIATGARPSVDLLGPLKVDALAIRDQINACRAVGVGRVVLVSSLCAGRWLHPLNLFGLILVWKEDSRAEREGIVFSGPDQQESSSIPRRLVARVCVDAVITSASEGRIVEITSREGEAAVNLAQWLAA
jgi:NAD(P)-dependent dehydrogenase (short-subunit alcohol dehydrogenase family)